MTQAYTHRLTIKTATANKELLEVASQVAELLPFSQWIEKTNSILLGNPDLNAIKTAVKLAGGEDFKVEPPLDMDRIERIRISVDGHLIFDSDQNANRGNYLSMLDESRLLFRPNYFVQELLQVPGVPNTTYCVENNQVFVFAALHRQVETMLRADPTAAISKVALLALPNAWVEAKEAVEQFDIVPIPYKRIELEGRLAIMHEPFNAVLPPRFETQSSRSAAIARLLLGKVLAGSGEFEFRGQPMTMLEPLDLNLLPPAPEVNILESENQVLTYYQASIHYSCLGNTEYIPGFPLLDSQAFSAIRATEISWVGANMSIIGLVYDEVSYIWQKITHVLLNWKLLNIDYGIPNSEVKNLDQLRNAYPELASLSDEALYCSFDSYQLDCCGVLDWSPNREDGFIFYLLGLLCIGEQANSEDAKKAGKFVAYKLLHNTVPSVLEQGKILFDYHTALHNLVWRTRKIIDFLRSTEPN